MSDYQLFPDVATMICSYWDDLKRYRKSVKRNPAEFLRFIEEKPLGDRFDKLATGLADLVVDVLSLDRKIGIQLLRAVNRKILGEPEIHIISLFHFDARLYEGFGIHRVLEQDITNIMQAFYAGISKKLHSGDIETGFP